MHNTKPIIGNTKCFKSISSSGFVKVIVVFVVVINVVFVYINIKIPVGSFMFMVKSKGMYKFMHDGFSTDTTIAV